MQGEGTGLPDISVYYEAIEKDTVADDIRTQTSNGMNRPTPIGAQGPRVSEGRRGA